MGLHVNSDDEDEGLMALLKQGISNQDSEDSTPSANIAGSSVPTHPLAPFPSTTNLDILVATATSTTLILSSTNHRPTRGASKCTYEDLDKDGELGTDTGPTPKRKASGGGAAGHQMKIVNARANGNGGGHNKPKRSKHQEIQILLHSAM